MGAAGHPVAATGPAPSRGKICQNPVPPLLCYVFREVWLRVFVGRCPAPSPGASVPLMRSVRGRLSASPVLILVFSPGPFVFCSAARTASQRRKSQTNRLLRGCGSNFGRSAEHRVRSHTAASEPNKLRCARFYGRISISFPLKSNGGFAWFCSQNRCVACHGFRVSATRPYMHPEG